jgi:hypothetical protein
MTVHVDDIHLDVVLDGNQQCNILNPKNLKGKMSNQGVRELVASICHDNFCE